MEAKQQFKVHLKADTDAEPPGADERALLFDATRELLLNALKHSGVRRAQVRVERTSDGCCQIVCEDGGRGFDAASVKAGPSGGFGLFSIQQRLLQMGGTLEIESAAGHGTKAVLTIPIDRPATTGAADAAPATGAVRAASREPQGGRIKVLLVDDHRIVRQGLASLMQFETDLEIVAEAEDGRQAIEAARQHTPDVVVMDVNMPVMNGIDATRVLTREMPRVKVVGLSMHLDADAANAMREAGAVAFLTKGSPPEDLIATIRACARKAATTP
jgi:CheY-like chemotaxis protein